MKIDNISINGFKKLQQFSLSPKGKSVEICGDNGQGKSSVIDAIWVALTGKEVPGKPINTDSVTAKIVVDLDDGHTVTMKFSKAGKTLSVENPAGEAVKAPAGYLEKLIGRISFDPFEFVEMPPAKQKAFLQQLLGVDFAPLDAKKAKILEEKRDIDSEIKSIDRQIQGLADAKEVKKVDVSELLAAQAVRTEKQRTLDAAGRQMADLAKSLEAEEAANLALVARIADLQMDLQTSDNKIALTKERITKGRFVIKNLEEEFATIPDNASAILSAGETNAQAERWERKKALYATFRESEKALDVVKSQLEVVENDRKEMLFSAKFPVDGMEFTEDGVMFKGLPFDKGNQCMSDILKVGVAIAVAQNPALKIVRIKDGSLLGTTKKADLLAMLEREGFQAFIETVADGDLRALTIEETEV